MPQPTFEQELEALINKHSMENGSDTPDFILAAFLTGVLDVWNVAVMRREDWYTDAETAEEVEEALQASALLPPPTFTAPAAIQDLRSELEQARKEFRAGCRQILWRSLENVDQFAEAIGDVSVGEAVAAWVQDLMVMIGQSVEETPTDDSSSKPS